MKKETIQTEVNGIIDGYYSHLPYDDITPQQWEQELARYAEDEVDEETIHEIANNIVYVMRANFDASASQKDLDDIMGRMDFEGIYGKDSVKFLPDRKVEYVKHISQDNGDSDDSVETFVYSSASAFADEVLAI